MRSLLCILIVLLLTACGNKINSKFIAQADSLLEGRPDSAYAILKKNYHATASFVEEPENALFAYLCRSHE